MEEHKENIHGKDVNVKMSNAKEEEKVGMSSFVLTSNLKRFGDLSGIK